MSANNTPQSYLARMRPDSPTRDMSMEQRYTNSGNPGGYVPNRQAYSPQPVAQPPQPQFNSPQQRYTPPMENGPNGAWNQGNGNYVIPQQFGKYGQNNYSMPLPTFGNQGIYGGIYNQFANPVLQSMQQKFGQMPFMPQFNQQQQPNQALADKNNLALQYQLAQQQQQNAASFQGAANPQPASGVTPNGVNQLNALTGGAYSGGGAPAPAPPQPNRGGYMPSFSQSAPAGARAPVRLF